MKTSLPALLLALVAIAPAPVLGQNTYAEFMKKYRRAVEYNDLKGLDRALRSHTDHALTHFNGLLWKHARDLTEANYKPIQQMKESWSRVFETKTLDHYQRFVNNKTEEDRKTLYQAERNEKPVFDLYYEGLNKKDRKTLERAREQAEQLANTYQRLGHAISAAKFWSLTAEIISKYPNVTIDERRDALMYRNSFISQRKQWEWTKDALYLNQVNFVKAEVGRIEEAEKTAAKRKAEGYDENAIGIDKLVMPKAKETIVPLTFEALKKPNNDMFLKGGTLPGNWMMIVVVGTGPAQIHYFTRQELYFVRPGSNDFGVTTEGTVADMKKNPWQAIEVPTKKKPSVFHLGPNKTKPYAMWLYKAKQQDFMTSLTHGQMPQNATEKAYIYYRSASSWHTTIGGEKITFYDDNCNGKLLEEDPLAYDLKDRTRKTPEGVVVPAFDSMKVGKGPHTPISAFTKIGDQWFHMQPHMEGEQVGVRPLNPEYFKTGSIEFQWKGNKKLKPQFLIVSGRGTYKGAHFNIAGSKITEVPAGEYEVSFGRISMGKGERGMQACIFGDKMDSFVVKEGETKKLTFGAPFRIDCTAKRDTSDLVIDATSICVVGAAGERYTRITVPLIPEVIYSKKKGKSGKVIGEFMPMNLTAYEAARNGNYADTGVDLLYYCLPKGRIDGKFDLELVMPSKGGFVGLQQKKHKMFGKLGPVWKTGTEGSAAGAGSGH